MLELGFIRHGYALVEGFTNMMFFTKTNVVTVLLLTGLMAGSAGYLSSPATGEQGAGPQAPQKAAGPVGAPQEAKPAAAAAQKSIETIESDDDPLSFLPNAPLLQSNLSLSGVNFSPDGKLLAIVGGDEDTQGVLRVSDATNGKLRYLVREPKGIKCVAFSRDSKVIATGEFGGGAFGKPLAPAWVKLRDAASGKVIATLEHVGWISSLAFSPDGKTLAAGLGTNGPDSAVAIWDLDTRKMTARLQGHTDAVMSIAFSPDSKWLVSGSRDTTAIVWDLAGGQKRHTLKGHTQAIWSVAVAPDGQTIATAGPGGSFRLWDATRGESKQGIGTFGAFFPVACVAFSPDGKLVGACGGGVNTLDGGIAVYDAATGRPLSRVSGLQPVTALAFSPDSTRMATVSEDAAAKIFDVPELTEPFALNDENNLEPQPATAMAYSADGRFLAIAGEDGTVQLCEAGSGIQRFALKGHQDVVTGLAFAPNSKVLATAGPDKMIKLWDPADGKEIRTLKGHTNWIYSLAFSPDSKKLASASYDKSVRLWDADSGAVLGVLQGHRASVRAVAFAPDGKTVASGSSDSTIKVWDIATASERLALKGHEGSVLALLFMADGKTLVSAGEDKTARLWDFKSGKQRFVLSGHTQDVVALAMTPRGRTLVTGSLDGTVKVWDPLTGGQRGDFQAHKGGVLVLALSPSGRQLASGGNDKKVKVWTPILPAPFSPRARFVLPISKQGLWWVTVTADGKRFAAGGDGGIVRFWDFEPDTLQYSLPLPSPGLATAFAPDGKTVAVSAGDGSIDLRDAVTGESRLVLKGHSLPVVSISFTPDGTKLVSAASDWKDLKRQGEVKIWEVTTGKALAALAGHEGLVAALAVSPDGRTLATAGEDRTARLWNLADGKQSALLRGHGDVVRALAFTAGGKNLVTAGWDSSIKVWNVADGKELSSLTVPLKGIDSLALAPGGTTTAVISEKSGADAKLGHFQAWHLEAGQRLADIKLSSGPVAHLAFAPDGKMLAVASGRPGQSSTVTLWDPTYWQTTGQLETDSALNVAFSSDSRRLVIAGRAGGNGAGSVSSMSQGSVTVWKLAGIKELPLTLKTGLNINRAAAFSPDGKILATGGGAGQVQLWDTATGENQKLAVLKGAPGTILNVAFSPDGRFVANGVASKQSAATVWDVAERKVKAVIGHSEWIRGLVFTPDSKALISIGRNGTAKILDLETGMERPSIKVTRTDGFAAISADGKWLALAAEPEGTQIWDMAAGKEHLRLSRGGDGVALSPDGKLLVTADHGVKLYDVLSGQELADLCGPEYLPLLGQGTDRYVHGVAFSSDGKTVLSAASDGAVCVWQLPPGLLKR